MSLAVSAFLLGLFVLYLVARAVKQTEGLPTWKIEIPLVLGVLLAMFDTCTDCIFVWTLSRVASSVLLWLSVGTLILPTVLNIVFVVKMFNTPGMLDFWRFFHKQPLPCSLVFVLSTSNTGLLKLMTSKLVGMDAFNAPIHPRAISRAEAAELITLVFENIQVVEAELKISHNYIPIGHSGRGV